jgi:hypothetical protein
VVEKFVADWNGKRVVLMKRFVEVAVFLFKIWGDESFPDNLL